MIGWIAEASPRLVARAAGIFWLLTIVFGASALAAPAGLGVAANLVATGCYVVATLLVYDLLKPVSRSLSLLAASLSILGCLIGTAGSLFHIALLPSNINFMFFGLHCLLVGGLILRSTFLPRIVGALMVFGGLGWLTQSLATLVSPELGRSLFPYILAPGILGEGTLTLWLLLFGVNVRRWEEQAGAARGRLRPAAS